MSLSFRTILALTLCRTYDASIGRWLSEDPLGFGAGPNNYAYVNGNPIGLTDPLGLTEDKETFKGGLAKGAVTGLGVGIVAGVTVAAFRVLATLAVPIAVVGIVGLVIANYQIYSNFNCISDSHLHEMAGET